MTLTDEEIELVIFALRFLLPQCKERSQHAGQQSERGFFANRATRIDLLLQRLEDPVRL